MNWHDLEVAAPELARRGRERFDATHVALLGTLRRDGSPRISPIEPYFVRGELLLGMLLHSLKARDLERDARCVLHSSVADVNGSEGEFKLHGRAVLVTDAELLAAESAAWWNAPDATEARIFAMHIHTAAHISWDIRKGEMAVVRWDTTSGLAQTSGRY